MLTALLLVGCAPSSGKRATPPTRKKQIDLVRNEKAEAAARRQAALHLANEQWLGREAIGILVEMVDDADPEVRRGAVDGLASIITGRREDMLRQAPPPGATDADRSKYQTPFFGPDVNRMTKALLVAARDTDADVRRFALSSLPLFAEHLDEAIGVAIAALMDENEQVHQQAKFAAEMLKARVNPGAKSHSDLKHALQHPDPEIRKLAGELLSLNAG